MRQGSSLKELPLQPFDLPKKHRIAGSRFPYVDLPGCFIQYEGDLVTFVKFQCLDHRFDERHSIAARLVTVDRDDRCHAKYSVHCFLLSKAT